jgi:hypothetical protein
MHLRNLLDRRRAINYVLLAPDRFQVSNWLTAVTVNRPLHDELTSKLQQFRGSQYVREGAIAPSDLDETGRHVHYSDNSGWHVLMLDAVSDVQGCAKFKIHETNGISFDKLGLRHSSLAHNEHWGARLRSAVAEIEKARLSDQAYGEIGGWAVAEQLRFTKASVYLALTIFGLGRLLGGCRGISTATVRNNSAGILRRLGGQSLVTENIEIPRYYDSRFGCEMEVLSI